MVVKDRNKDAYFANFFVRQRNEQQKSWIVDAFHAETSSIKVLARTQVAAMSRFSFWRDMLENPSERQSHPIGPALNILAISDLEFLRQLNKAKERDIMEGSYKSCVEVESYGEAVYGAIAQVCFGQMSSPYNKLMALTTFMRGAPHLCSVGIDPGLPEDILAKNNISNHSLLSPWPPQMADVGRQLHDLAMSHYQGVPKSYSFSQAVCAHSYLNRLRKAGYRLDCVQTHSSHAELLAMTAWNIPGLWRRG